MKIILLFALIGLSFYQASGYEDCPKPYTPDPKEYTCKSTKVAYGHTSNCLQQALTESAELVHNVGTFLCEYNACKRGENAKNYKQAAKAFIYAVACLGCQLDKILGTGYTIQHVLTEISEFDGEVGEHVEKIVASLKVAEPVANILCSVTTFLNTGCAQNALANLAPSVVKGLTVRYCQEESKEKSITAERTDILEESKEKSIIAELTAILKDLGCILDEIAETEDKLEKNLESLGDTLMPVVGSVLNLTKKVPVVGNLLCPVLNGLLGKGGLLGVLGGIEGVLGGVLGKNDKDDDGGILGLFGGK